MGSCCQSTSPNNSDPFIIENRWDVAHTSIPNTVDTDTAYLQHPLLHNKYRYDRALLVVNAYIHKHGDRNFLLDLIKIIATYYNIIDVWSSEYKGSYMQILEGTDNTKVLKIRTCHQCIFGTEEISDGIFVWKIRVNTFRYSEGYWHVYLGVINIDKVDMNFVAQTHPERMGCYTFDVFKGNVCNEAYTKRTFKTKVMSPGDIVEIKLNLDLKSVHCKINDKDIGEMITKIEDGKYRLLASIYFDETELEIL